MANLEIRKDEKREHTRKDGMSPETGRTMVIRDGQAGTPGGRENPSSERSFGARNAVQRTTTYKMYSNKLRWDDKAKRYTVDDIPNEGSRKD
jgi:hypothetical protein